MEKTESRKGDAALIGSEQKEARSSCLDRWRNRGKGKEMRKGRMRRRRLKEERSGGEIILMKQKSGGCSQSPTVITSVQSVIQT